MVVRPTESRIPKDPVRLTKLLVPLDGSGLAEGILPYVKGLATRLFLGVVLLRVFTVAAMVHAAAEVPTRVFDMLEVEAKAEAERYLSQVSRDLARKGVLVEHELLKGAPGASIVDYAHKTEGCMVAMSTHGRTGLGRLVLGSVADHVIRHSGAPVLVFRPRQSE
jgi:nucleotide-binding universal stress UspA family protein